MKHKEFIDFLVEYVICCDDILSTLNWWEIVHRIRVLRRRETAKFLYRSFRKLD